MSGIVGQPNQKGSGKVGPPTGTVVQTAVAYAGSGSTLSSSGATNVVFGHEGTLPTITAGNHVLIECTMQVNTSNADQVGGFIYLMRGHWSTTAQSTIEGHADNLAVNQNDASGTAIPNHNAGNIHIYTTKANHTYWIYHFKFFDKKVVSTGANTQSTATTPRYCLGVVSHPAISGQSIRVVSGGMYPTMYTMQEIAA